MATSEHLTVHSHGIIKTAEGKRRIGLSGVWLNVDQSLRKRRRKRITENIAKRENCEEEDFLGNSKAQVVA